MDGLFKQLGRTQGSVKDRIERLKLDLQYPNPTSEASREQVMKDFNAIIQDAAKRSEAMFDLRPKAPVIGQPFPTFREANAAANYNAPTADGSRPGIVQFPRRIERMAIGSDHAGFKLKQVLVGELQHDDPAARRHAFDRVGVLGERQDLDVPAGQRGRRTGEVLVQLVPVGDPADGDEESAHGAAE